MTLPAERAEALESRVQAGIYSDINGAITRSLDKELGVEEHPSDLPAAAKDDLKERIAELDQRPHDHSSRTRSLEDLHQAMQHTRASTRGVSARTVGHRG